MSATSDRDNAVSYQSYDWRSAAQAIGREQKAPGVGKTEAKVKSGFEVSVLLSPRRRRRVKLVGPHLHGLAPVFARWADALDKELRVVNTQGEAPYEYYGRAMVALRLQRRGRPVDALCVFLTGPDRVDEALKKSDVKWRVGLREIAGVAAPAALDSSDFPAYSNIRDERGVFLGRVEGKFLYTMLYIPERATAQAGEALKAAVAGAAKDAGEIVPYVDYVMGKYQQMLRQYGRELSGELTPVSFREFCGDSMRKRQKAVGEEIVKSQKSLRDAEVRLIELSRKLREQQKEMTLIQSGAVDDELSEEAERLEVLVKAGLYDKFKVRNGRIMGISAPVVIEHEGRKFELGKFLVSIKQDGKTVEVRHESKGHPFHPHVSKDTEQPCLGTVRDDVPKLLGMERYSMVFQIMSEWLNSYNPSSRYHTIEACVGMPEPAADPRVAVPVAPGVVATANAPQDVPDADRRDAVRSTRAAQPPFEAGGVDLRTHGLDQSNQQGRPLF